MHVLCDFAMFCLNFHTLDHIWTNLLTQCTQLPVPVFCCFCISGFPAIKSAQKSGKIILKISVKEPSGITKGGKGGHHQRPGGSLARPHPRPCQEASWLPGGSPRHPLRLYLALGVKTPNIDLFSANSPLYRRRRRFKIRAAWRSCPGTLPGGGTPSGRPSIAMDASQMCRE